MVNFPCGKLTKLSMNLKLLIAQRMTMEVLIIDMNLFQVNYAFWLEKSVWRKHSISRRANLNQSIACGVNLVRKSFEIDINEYQLKRVIKALTAALKELGFKPSKVSKIINSARFLQTYDWFEEAKCYFGSNSEKIGKDLFDELSEYFVGFGVGSLDVLSRMTKEAEEAYRHFLKKEFE